MKEKNQLEFPERQSSTSPPLKWNLTFHFTIMCHDKYSNLQSNRSFAIIEANYKRMSINA